MYQFLEDLEIAQLLILRFVLDTQEPYCDMDRDMQDLYQYPERLRESYPEEWRFYIKRQLRQRNIDPQAVVAWLAEPSTDILTGVSWPLTEMEQTCYKRYLLAIEHAETITASNNVRVLNTPLHSWLERALS